MTSVVGHREFAVPVPRSGCIREDCAVDEFFEDDCAGRGNSRMGLAEQRPATATLEQQQKQKQEGEEQQGRQQQQQQQISDAESAGKTASGTSNDSYTKMDPPGDEFPVGMRVLVVDDDRICLVVLERMLRRCAYQVTTCWRAAKALELLRANKDAFDVVISDVHMPDMDGFKLLEHVGLEMDLPVIMMSANGSVSAVMKGITHGACDYLLKPVRIEELRNIWQHVVRKRRNVPKELDKSVSADGVERQNGECASSANDTTDANWKLSKKRKEAKELEDDNELDGDDPSCLKKPRVVWSVDLHQQFVCAVNQLGVEKAVPKRILELMGVQGLTRENVASHLQKYRLYLRRLTSQQGGDPTFGPGSFDFSSCDGDFRALAGGSGQLPDQTLAALRAGLLTGSRANDFAISGDLDTSSLLQFADMQGSTNVGPAVRPQMSSAPLIGGQTLLFQGVAGGLDLDRLAQPHHVAALRQPGVMDEATTLAANIQHQVVETSGVGTLSTSPPGRAQPENALIMQLLQQRAGADNVSSVRTGGLLPLGASCLDTRGLSDFLGTGRRVTGPPPGSMVATISNALDALIQPNTDVNYPGQSSRVVPVTFPPSGMGTGSPVINERPNEATMRANLLPSRYAGNGCGQGMSQNNIRSGWSGPQKGLTSLHDELGLPQVARFDPHCDYNHVATSNQLSGGVASGQHAPGMIISSRLAADRAVVGPLYNGGNHQNGSEASTTDSNEKQRKDQRRADSVYSKLECQLLSTDASSDDLFNMVFNKQQAQAGNMSFLESDLGSDGYVLDGLFVK